MNSKDSIPLHPKYGLNPTMPVCLVCGKPDGSIALLGNHYKEKAPRNMVLSIEPCPACRKLYLEEGKGVLMVEADQARKPTGSILIIKEEAFKLIFGKESALLPSSKVVMCAVGVIARINKNIAEAKKALENKPEE